MITNSDCSRILIIIISKDIEHWCTKFILTKSKKYYVICFKYNLKTTILIKKIYVNKEHLNKLLWKKYIYITKTLLLWLKPTTKTITSLLII